MNNNHSFLSLLQLSSPALPNGAYSYSEGLENLVINQIDNQEKLYSWLQQELTSGTIRIEAAIMLRACHNFNDLEQLEYWNNWLTAAKETKELRQQSWQMGKSLIQLLTQLTQDSKLREIQNKLSYPCHYPLSFGIGVAYWEINAEMALLAYLHSWAANLISAGVKLIPLGQTTGQKILMKINQDLLKEYQTILNLGNNDLYSCTLGLGLASMNHEAQYSRLFRS